MSGSTKTVRLDKWLWAARCFKTRSKATEACASGQVKVNEQASKAGRPLRVDDMVDVQTPGGQRILKVVALAQRRESAAVAATLFKDLTPEQPRRSWFDRKGPRPTKRDRRMFDQLRDLNRDD